MDDRFTLKPFSRPGFLDRWLQRRPFESYTKDRLGLSLSLQPLVSLAQTEGEKLSAQDGEHRPFERYTKDHLVPSCPRLGVIEFHAGCAIREIHGFSRLDVSTITLPPSIEVLGANAFARCSQFWLVRADNAPRVRVLAGFNCCTKLSVLGAASGQWAMTDTWDLTGWSNLRIV
jgi:hypothetical protein